MHPATKADEECVWKGGERSSLRDAALRARARSATTVALTEGAFSWKGFFSREMALALDELGVSFYLKGPNFHGVRARLGEARRSKKDPARWTRSGTLYGARLLSVEHRNKVEDPEALELECWEVTKRAHVLTNVDGIHALSAWRAYNAGAVVEDRIKEMGELGIGRTAVDDLRGNALLWSLGALTYELLHWIRTTALSGPWRRAQPNRLRAWLFRLPAKLTTHARKQAEAVRAAPTDRTVAPGPASGAAPRRHRTTAARLSSAGAGPRGEEDRNRQARWWSGYARRCEIGRRRASRRPSRGAEDHLGGAPAFLHRHTRGEIGPLELPVQDPG